VNRKQRRLYAHYLPKCGISRERGREMADEMAAGKRCQQCFVDFDWHAPVDGRCSDCKHPVGAPMAVLPTLPHEKRQREQRGWGD
jgi:hypothetical protein